ncbi:MAG: hypothetical protein M3Z75_11795 [Actinomycetota bacterium]|nr:hypothetical protein [Actinomycetota bacterium]
MGSEVLGPGAQAPGPVQVTASVARAWAVAAANAATRVPAGPAEADAWTVRGWADVAVGCLALDGPSGSRPGPALVAPGRQARVGAFSGLDEVVRDRRIVSGGEQAARLRQLRRLAGPVPPWYPDTDPVSGPVRRVSGIAWRAAGLLSWFGELLLTTARTLPQRPPCPLVSARQLAWGLRYRPSPSDEHVTLGLPVDRRLARRTWMCLPGLPGAGTAIAEVPSTATPLEQQVWRGIHEGAHLDHLASLARLGPGGPPAPDRGEFGAGLLIAESYAMAVEILAAVECVLAGEGHAVRQLGAGLIERATRLPGGTNSVAEFTDLPVLAEVYLLGPLEVLAGGAAADALPDEIAGPLRDRWQAALAAYPPAAAFGSAAAALITRSAEQPL